MNEWIGSVQRWLYRMEYRLGRYQKQLWFAPVLFILLAILLAILTSVLDQRLALIENSPLLVQDTLLFGGDATGARALLTTIAGAWTTLMGVVFSITMVVLQLASNKFTAQVIPRVEKDRITQITMGSYAGIVAFSLLLLRTVRESGPQAEGFVPYIGINLAVLWALLSFVLTAWFMTRLSDMDQPINLVRAITHDGIRAIDKLVAWREPDWVRPSEEPLAMQVGGDGRAIHATETVGPAPRTRAWRWRSRSWGGSSTSSASSTGSPGAREQTRSPATWRAALTSSGRRPPGRSKVPSALVSPPSPPSSRSIPPPPPPTGRARGRRRARGTATEPSPCLCLTPSVAFVALHAPPL